MSDKRTGPEKGGENTRRSLTMSLLNEGTRDHSTVWKGKAEGSPWAQVEKRCGAAGGVGAQLVSTRGCARRMLLTSALIGQVCLLC